jgi:hypothetical protein
VRLANEGCHLTARSRTRLLKSLRTRTEYRYARVNMASEERSRGRRGTYDVGRSACGDDEPQGGEFQLYRDCRTRTILARAEPLVMVHLGVLNHPDDHRDNHDHNTIPSTSTPAGVLSRSLIRRMRFREPR